MQFEPQRPAQRAAPILWGTLAGIAGVLFPPAMLLIPALWAYAMCKTGPGSLLVCGGVFAVLASLALGTFGGACFAVLCIGGAAALYYMQTKKIGNAYTVAAVSGVALVCLYALVCLPGILSGDGAFAAVEAVAKESAETLRAFVAATGAVPAESTEQFFEMYDVYMKALPTLIVPALCIAAGVLGLGNFLFFRLFARNKGLDITPLRAFRLWSIPRELATGLIVMLLGSLLLGLTGWDYADALTNTVSVLVGMPLLLQGLCVLDFILSRKQDGRVTARRVLTYLVTGMLLVVVQTPLIMLGCFEQMLHFRARALWQPPAQP